jgi:hypothetical protein
MNSTTSAPVVAPIAQELLDLIKNVGVAWGLMEYAFVGGRGSKHQFRFATDEDAKRLAKMLAAGDITPEMSLGQSGPCPYIVAITSATRLQEPIRLFKNNTRVERKDGYAWEPQVTGATRTKNARKTRPTSDKPRVERLSPKALELSGEIQPRARIDEKLVDEYAVEWKGGAVFPHVVVFEIGMDPETRTAQYVVVDGFYRVLAAHKGKISAVLCEIHEGTRDDAPWHALSASQSYGLGRSNEDERKGGPGRGHKSVSHAERFSRKQVHEFRRMAWPEEHRNIVAEAIRNGKWKRRQRLMAVDFGPARSGAYRRGCLQVA